MQLSQLPKADDSLIMLASRAQQLVSALPGFASALPSLAHAATAVSALGQAPCQSACSTSCTYATSASQQAAVGKHICLRHMQGAGGSVCDPTEQRGVACTGQSGYTGGPTDGRRKRFNYHEGETQAPKGYDYEWCADTHAHFQLSSAYILASGGPSARMS